MELKVIYIFLMTLLISGCMHAIDSILVSILTFTMLRILKNQDQSPDLDGWPWLSRSIHFFESNIISNVSHHSYIIYFKFFEFLDLDYVKINSKIKYVACIQPKIIKVIRNYVWPWFSRLTIKVRRHMLVILRFPTSDMFESTARISMYNVQDEQGITIMIFKVIRWSQKVKLLRDPWHRTLSNRQVELVYISIQPKMKN